MRGPHKSKVFQGSALALLLLVPPLPEPKPLSASAIFERESPYIVTIRTFDNPGNQVGQASGVVIAANPDAILIATNLHVLRGACDVSVDIPGEEQPKSIWAVAGLDSDNDVVAITVRGGKTRRTGKWSEWKNSELKVGHRVYAIGNPMGLELTISEGIVSGIRRTLQGTQIQITSPISPGSSGGGLYDRYGRLVGITSSSIEGGQNLNFAVPIEAVIGRFQAASTGTDWREVKESFCGSNPPTLDELKAVLGLHVSNPSVRDFFSKLGGGRIPEPSRVDLSALPGITAAFYGDVTDYSFFSSLGLLYSAKDGVVFRVRLYGPGAIKGAEAYYTGDLPFGLQWGMSGHEVREKFGSRYRKDDIVYEDEGEGNLILVGQRGNYRYPMIVKSDRLVLVQIEVPLP